MSTSKTFGQFLSDVRKKSGYASPKDLAVKAGISFTDYTKYEFDEERPPVEALMAISPLLSGTSLAELKERAGFVDLTQEQVPTQIPRSKRLRDLVARIEELSDDQLDELHLYVGFLVVQQEISRIKMM
ncbi:helix-turn-helix domain-containing protein [Brevibacillus dissolubilis]|uniref:helix-turn-helix domain-containing protein n=1 Tax=Brevibacillus dissolubilis TaxID=1844116 RepID=UPI001117AABD|nr:helix-turn-helix transcriptional regulator [Brevibacillus dissolubilis]